jgi:3,4-dihydroxy 2-butanone 4-phosphate synthase / GTP cyclohydrolase II
MSISARLRAADHCADADDTFSAAITAIRDRMVVLVDDVSEPLNGPTGFLVVAAQFADTEQMAFLVRETSGFICVAVTPDRLDRLMLPLLAPNACGDGIKFAVAVDLRHGLTTGISARDRAMTVRALADPATQPDDLARPGHVMPLCAAAAGVLERASAAEAAIDLCRAAGLQPVAAFAAVLDSTGELASLEDLTALATAMGCHWCASQRWSYGGAMRRCLDHPGHIRLLDGSVLRLDFE